MKVELLYFDGCPAWQSALANLRVVLGEGHAVYLLRVETPEQAEAVRFPGSPTIRIDGRDLFPVQDGQYALACRIYKTPDGESGTPTVEMIESALTQ